MGNTKKPSEEGFFVFNDPPKNDNYIYNQLIFIKLFMWNNKI